MKKVRYVLSVVLILAIAFSLVACGGSINTPTQLTMGELNYDNATKTISWDKVANASGYEIKIGADGTYSASGITESGNKMQYALTLADGNYTVSVIAKGDGTSYSDSAAKTKSITVSTQIVKVTQELAAPTIGFDSANGIVYWNTVANANGYTLLINNISKMGALASDRMEYQLTEYGEFTAKVTALGQETSTHIYTNSPQASYSGDWQEPSSGKTQSQLETPEIGFDDTNGIVYWNTVDNADGYTLLINDVSKTGTLVSGRMEYQLTEYGEFTAKVTALGQETATDIYADSAQATYSAEWVDNSDQRDAIVYSEIIALVQQKATDTWKIGKFQSLVDSLKEVNILGINLLTGQAYFEIVRNYIELYTLNLGILSGKTLAQIYDLVDTTTYVTADLSAATTLQSSDNTEALLASLMWMGYVKDEVIWAKAKNWSGIIPAYADIYIALRNGTLVTYTLPASGIGVAVSKTAQFVGDGGSVTTKSTIDYTDLSTLAVAALQPKTYNFVTNGGKTVQSVTTAYKAIMPITTRAGWYFAGWYDNVNLEGNAIHYTYCAEEGQSTTLYAKWSAIPISGLTGKSYATAYPLAVSTPTQVTLAVEGESACYAFTPATTKSYTISSTGGESNKYFGIHFHDSVTLVNRYAGASTINFTLTQTLTAGVTYYFIVYPISVSSFKTGTITMTIS